MGIEILKVCIICPVFIIEAPDLWGLKYYCVLRQLFRSIIEAPDLWGLKYHRLYTLIVNFIIEAPDLWGLKYLSVSCSHNF